MGFESFLGNKKALAEVRNMLAARRASGALLFSGPDGVGKKTLAVMLAKALNCQRLDGGFCGKCAHCLKCEEMLTLMCEDTERRRVIKEAQRRVEGLVYLDLQLIEPLTRNILIEQVRQMRRVAYTRPFQLAQRVFVIDEVQTVHWQAVDLLLKMLEEPPETTTFILVCPNAYELRATIRSRCRRVQFVPVEDSIISQILERERHLTAAQLTLGIRIANGSIAAAKKLDLPEFQRRRRPWVDFLDAVTGAAAGHGKAAAGGQPRPRERNWPAISESAKAVSENREEFEEELRIGYMLLEDLLHAGNSPGTARIMNVDLQSELAKWASALGVHGIETLKNGLDQAYRLQTRNVNQQIGLEALAVEVVSGQVSG